MQREKAENLFAQCYFGKKKDRDQSDRNKGKHIS